MLIDVRSNPGVEHDFICGRCHRARLSAAQQIGEALASWTAPPNWSGVIAERRRRLNESLWATATDGTVSEAEATAWAAYRAAVVLIGPETVQSPSSVTWPSPPA